jgi:hypothetical protein
MIASLNASGIAAIINVCVHYVTIVINKKQSRRRPRNTFFSCNRIVPFGTEGWHSASKPFEDIFTSYGKR